VSTPAHISSHLAEHVPAGRWAVGVSGGADSVALLLLLNGLPDLSLHVVHLDHETRAGASTGDARFVRELAQRLNLTCTIDTRSTVEATLADVPSNPSARFRAARLGLFRRVVREHALDGVILAHHADDQAETVLHRLLRSSGASGLSGMSARSRVGGLLILRPLLSARRADLRAVMHALGQPWREDASNASDDYLRNRLRRVLSSRPRLTDALLHLSASCAQVREWSRANVPGVAPTLRVADLLRLPEPLQRELAARWLRHMDVPEGRVERDVVERLLTMARDAATSPRQEFPGAVIVRRSRGTLSAQHLRAELD
jgi:tRNA(Ile)-lysidine synthase